MKTRIVALLLTAALLPVSGCGAATMESRMNPAENQAMTASAQETALTEEEAVAIALEHAGLTEDQISGLRVRYEIDDRVPEYEIEFRQGLREYDYTIHAETGEIMSYDQGD